MHWRWRLTCHYFDPRFDVSIGPIRKHFEIQLREKTSRKARLWDVGGLIALLLLGFIYRYIVILSWNIVWPRLSIIWYTCHPGKLSRKGVPLSSLGHPVAKKPVHWNNCLVKSKVESCAAVLQNLLQLFCGCRADSSSEFTYVWRNSRGSFEEIDEGWENK